MARINCKQVGEDSCNIIRVYCGPMTISLGEDDWPLEDSYNWLLFLDFGAAITVVATTIATYGATFGGRDEGLEEHEAIVAEHGVIAIHIFYGIVKQNPQVDDNII
jgi:hypothetical protein